MDIVITNIQARRIQRLARQKGPELILLRGMMPSMDELPYSSNQLDSVVLPVLESIGVFVAGEKVHIRVFQAGAKTRRKDIIVHRTVTSLPPNSFDQVILSDASLGLSLHEAGIRLFVDSPSLCVLGIIQEALASTRGNTLERQIVPLAKGLALASEFCGKFSRDPFAPDHQRPAFDIEPVLAIEELRQFTQRVGRPNGIATLRDLLHYLSDLHGSPMEVIIYALAVLRPQQGGLALPRPETNKPLKLRASDRQRISHHQITPDLYWEQYKEASEYDGGDHNTPQGIREDKRRIIDYQNLGIAVFPATSDNFKDTDSVDQYMRALTRHMEKYEGLRLKKRMDRLFADPNHRKKRSLLRNALSHCT